ncbi:MAG: ABC transporter permease [Nitrososphaerota archaeon]|nr:ABC transporter permease [Aigarchaeota archaeon]MDW8077068.1 ABC transporter permease [Nitrososphaerota archaeon]
MELVKNVRAILALVMFNGIKPVIRSPLWLVVMLAYPLILVFFIHMFAEYAVSDALVGGLISLVVMSGVALQADIVWYKMELKFQDMVVASPLSPTVYMVGIAVSELVYSSPAIVLFLILMALRGMIYVSSIPMLVPSILLCWLSALSIGFYLSTRISDIRHIWALEGLISILFSMLPPVYYPMSLLPEWGQVVSMLIPTTHAALLTKEAVGIISLTDHQRLLSIMALLIWTAVLMMVARRKSVWREP